MPLRLVVGFQHPTHDILNEDFHRTFRPQRVPVIHTTPLGIHRFWCFSLCSDFTDCHLGLLCRMFRALLHELLLSLSHAACLHVF